MYVFTLLLFLFIKACPNPDLMKNPAYIPAGQITSNAKSLDGSTPDDARIGGKTFNPPVSSLGNGTRPHLKVVLSATSTVLTSKIVIPPASSNIEKVTVLVPADQYQSYGSSMTTPSTITLSPGGKVAYVPIVKLVKPDPITGQVTFPIGLRVSEVVIVAESVKKNSNGTTPSHFKIEFGIHACVNGKFIVFKVIPLIQACMQLFHFLPKCMK